MKVYLDYNSTVPTSADHLKEVFAVLEKVDGNPSNTHFAGRSAKLELEKSRKRISNLFDAKPNQIIFNSGATEGNNHVLRSFVEKAKAENKTPVLIISGGEHSAIYETSRRLHELGEAKMIVSPLESSGRVDVAQLLQKTSSEIENPANAVLVSTIYVNNETGIVNPVEEISKSLNNISENIFYHVDAVQALGKFDLKIVSTLDINSLVISAHKVGGFKGVGCLYLKDPKSLKPILFGGGQERTLRSGTENLPGVISFGLRAEYISNNSSWLSRSKELFEVLVEKLSVIKNVSLHGDLNHSAKTTLNLHVDGKTIDKINLRLDMAGVAVSNGSACSSGVPKPSRVLVAMGLDEVAAANSLRISLGEKTTSEEIQYFIKCFSESIN